MIKKKAKKKTKKAPQILKNVQNPKWKSFIIKMYSKWFKNTFWTHIFFLEPKLKILKRFSTHKHIFECKTCRAKNYKIQMKIEIVQIQYWNDFFDTKTKCTFSLLKWLVWNILIIVVISTLFYNREYYIGPYDMCCIIDKYGRQSRCPRRGSPVTLVFLLF